VFSQANAVLLLPAPIRSHATDRVTRERLWMTCDPAFSAEGARLHWSLEGP
jgi:hypothetical protein